MQVRHAGVTSVHKAPNEEGGFSVVIAQSGGDLGDDIAIGSMTPAQARQIAEGLLRTANEAELLSMPTEGVQAQ